MKRRPHSARLTTTGSLSPEFRALAAEFVGTFVLTLFDAGAKEVAAITGYPSYVGQAIVPGLVVMALVYAIGEVSGAHVNPAVTLAFAVRGVFPRRRVLPYWAFQFAGAVAAGALLRALYGNVAHLGASEPQAPARVCWWLEVTLTFVLVTVIIGTATWHRVVGPNAALAVGGTIAACTLLGKSTSGGSMNPARSLGPALVSGHLAHIWIYLTAPATGAVIAVLVAAVLHARSHRGEREAARGEQTPR